MFRIQIILALVCVLCIPFAAHAGIISKPFGGFVTAIVPCTDGALAVYVKPTLYDPIPLPYIIRPTSRMYLFGPPTPGRYILGRALQAGVCVIGTVPTPGREALFYGTSGFGL